MRERPEVQEVLRLWLYRFVTSDGLLLHRSAQPAIGTVVQCQVLIERNRSRRMRSDRFRLGAALRASGPADMVPVDCDHPAIRGAVIAFVTERSCRRRAWLLLLGERRGAASR